MVKATEVRTKVKLLSIEEGMDMLMSMGSGIHMSIPWYVDPAVVVSFPDGSIVRVRNAQTVGLAIGQEVTLVQRRWVFGWRFMRLTWLEIVGIERE